MSLRDKLRNDERFAFIKNIADKLFQGIQNLQERGEPRRWIWELIQNAKDAPNSFGPVLIRVILKSDALTFEHNGDPFESEALTGLLQQVSSKASRPEDGTTTGKFGTGFITTHMLSKVIYVEGLLQFDGWVKRFRFELDRMAETPEDLMLKINSALEKKDELAEDTLYPPIPKDSIRQRDKFDTQFTYPLSPTTRRYAEQGMQDLILTGPYTLLFNEKIGEYAIVEGTNEQRLIRGKAWNGVSGVQYFQTHVVNHNNDIVRTDTIAYYKADELILAIPVVVDNQTLLAVQALPDNVPTLFKDFPLIGTERWMLSMACNSSHFEPTEPRDGLFLHLEPEGTNWQPNTNRRLVNKMLVSAVEFIEALQANGNPDGLYELTRSGLPAKEKLEDVSTFLKAEQQLFRDSVKRLKLVHTASGIKSMTECRFPLHPLTAGDTVVSKQFYNLCKTPFAEAVPIESHYEQWMQIVKEDSESWGEALVLKVEELLKHVSDSQTVDTLKLGNDAETLEWLNKLYDFIQQQNLSDQYAKYKLVPNQKRSFILLKDALLEEQVGIPEILKIAGDAFAKRYRERLVLQGVVCKAAIPELLIEEISNELNGEIGLKLTKPDQATGYVATLALLCNIKTDGPTDDRRLPLLRHLSPLVSELLHEPERVLQMRTAFNLEPALKALVRWCLYSISQTRTTDFLRATLNKENEHECVKWIEVMVRLVQGTTADIRSLLMDYAVFPNQNMQLRFANDLHYDVDAMPEFIKKLHEELFPTKALKNYLLHRQLTTDCVTKECTFEQIAGDIDRELLDNKQQRSSALGLIDWLEKNTDYRGSFMHLEREKALIVLESLPANKEPVFKLLRLNPDFDKLNKIAESEHFELLSEIAATTDAQQLKRLYDMAQNVGIDRLEEFVANHIEEQKDAEYRKLLGEHVENLFREAFEELGDAFTVVRDGYEHGQDFALKFSSAIYRVEIKSYAPMRTRVFMTEKQGEVATENATSYALCTLERSIPTPDKEFFKANARFVADIGVRLKDRVRVGKEITAMIERAKLDADNGIAFDSESYKFSIGKKNWESTSALTFEQFVNILKRTYLANVNIPQEVRLVEKNV